MVILIIILVVKEGEKLVIEEIINCLEKLDEVYDIIL